MYEAIIKVRCDDPPAKRRRDIEEGFGYAVVILMDEYGATAEEIESLLEREIDNAHNVWLEDPARLAGQEGKP